MGDIVERNARGRGRLECRGRSRINLWRRNSTQRCTGERQSGGSKDDAVLKFHSKCPFLSPANVGYTEAGRFDVQYRPRCGNHLAESSSCKRVLFATGGKRLSRITATDFLGNPCHA